MKIYPENKIREIIQEYENGRHITELSTEYQVAKSSIYRWVHSYTRREVASISEISQRELYLLQIELERLRIDNQIFCRCECSRKSPLTEKLPEMARLKDEFSVHALCRVLDVRRSTFYHYLYRRPKKTLIEIEDDTLRPRIRELFQNSKERFGARKIRAKLIAEGVKVSEKRIHRLMDEMELVCKQVRLRYWSTTSRKHKYYRNKLQQIFLQDAPDLVWVSDITYIRIKGDFHYVCVIIDLFSRKVLAHGIFPNINTLLVKTTFDKAFDSRNRPEGLMFHSDQGFQYTAFELRKYLRELKVNQSFSNSGTPLDNAVAESFFACMKREELSHNFYDTVKQLGRDVSEFVHYFNCEHPHQKLGFRTPEQVEKEYLG